MHIQQLPLEAAAAHLHCDSHLEPRVDFSLASVLSRNF